MGQKVQTKRSDSPAEIHITERDLADLERFREAMKKLTPEQTCKVIAQMLEKPDIQ